MSTRQNIVFCGLIVLLAVVSIAQSRKMVTITEAVKYLSRFGYLPPSVFNTTETALLDESAFTSALQHFQRFSGLKETGELDDATMELMSKPCCGNKKRSKRYILSGTYWNKTSLTYRITKYTEKLKRADVDTEISRAFALWSEHTNLDFTRKTTGEVDIEISFDDPDTFDDFGSALSYSTPPSMGGDVHFNNAAHWTINSTDGTNLFQTAAHEIGHALGLSHSKNPESLMASKYFIYQENFKLPADDIFGIQTLYGTRSIQGFNQLCTDSKIDTIFNSAEGQTYVLKGDNYYLLTQNSVADGYPKPIHSRWPGLPNNIDAAYTYKDGLTYFFKRTKCWAYNGSEMVNGYPKKIKTISRFIPNNMDSAMFLRDHDAIYFYKNNKCLTYCPQRKKRCRTKCSFPSAFIETGIDAAFTDINGHMYLFKDHLYYRDCNVTKDIFYPHRSATGLFGCKK